MRFATTKEMMDALLKCDLYSVESERYVFTYNDGGSICIYYIDKDEARKLAQMAHEDDEYWGAYLGTGGTVYDEPEWKLEELIAEDWIDTRDVYYEAFC